MQNWEKFEINATDYLNTNCGGGNTRFQQQGGSDSSIPDIRVLVNNRNIFNIEAKMSPSQAGQFVVRNVNDQFVYSGGNRSAKNRFSSGIIDHMNQDHQKYAQYGTHALIVDCPNDLAYDWIINHYQQKNSKFLIVSDKPDSFATNFIKLVPLIRIREEFNVATIFRIKRSGTRRTPQKDYELALESLRQNFGDDFVMNNKFEVTFPQSPPEQSQPLSNQFHLSQKTDDKFVVRKRSSTFNANIIFQLTFKGARMISGFDELKTMVKAVGGS